MQCMDTKRLARLAAAAATVTTMTLLGAGPVAQADPPPGWAPGEYGLEYDFADVGWTHRGWYRGVAGNVHTGHVNVEEDDDGLTVVLNDWFCPRGATPPSPSDPRGVATRCTWRSGKFVNYTQWWDVADFNHARNKLVVRGVFADSSSTDSVSVDLVIKALDDPEVVIDESGPILDYSESYTDVRAIGKVDGHPVHPAPNRTQTDGSIYLYLDGWERIPTA